MLSRFSFLGPWQRLTLTLWLLTFICFCFADIEIISLDPWSELTRMLSGFMAPDFFATESLLNALWLTVSFALLGVALGLLLGIPLAMLYQSPGIAAICAMVRGVHEIFWALLFLQLFGLSPLTGILAIGLPYGATFARVFHDILQQAPGATLQSFPFGVDRISRYVYGKLGHVYPLMLAYVRYRFECALRSSAVLGFIGMPTLGFYLETAFRQGNYHEGAALLLLLVLLIGTIAFWARRQLIAFYLLAALLTLPTIGSVDGLLIWQFLSVDLLPPGIKGVVHYQLGVEQGLEQFVSWWQALSLEQALPGIWATLVLAISALGVTHLLTLLGYFCVSRHRFGYLTTRGAQLGLLFLRSTPEYLLAFIFMMLWGPSMLPAIAALALHNGALIAYLVARQEVAVKPSPLYRPRNDHFAYEVLPRIYPNFMSLLFYRFEVILRETAIFGVLGIATLGFYIDSAFSEIRYSNALYLLLVTAILNVLVDFIARRLLANRVSHSVSLGQVSCVA
ncbi:ABC transporter permease [Shewanella sp. AS1]|uniref:PhnE/PtxC family ABC transporter permease n=1 Tax=Shewanella sp. AS1 TaxID=2907626 RepID=UPI001F23ECD2|nr:ABC transporter permease [Shewanella sp. AS1]MCE9678719.1 ABC transporter permease [Shewanella sp. AS1]